MDLAFLNLVPFLVAGVLSIRESRSVIPKTLMTWATAAVMAVSFVVLIGYLPYVQQEPVTFSIPWVPELGLNFSFYLDGLSLVFGLIVTGVGTMIFIYTGYYFEEADDQRRFMMWLMAFAGAMLGLVISGNTLMMFIMWELTSITSFMLIGFKGDKSESARFGATQALIITAGGGLALMAGLLVLGAAAAQIHPETGVAFQTNMSTILATEGLAEHPWYLGFTILLMLGAFTKSAQFPFHFWLPGAMEAPTPASSFLHSATMVKAGVYVLLRMYPPLHEHTFWTGALVFIGLTTMLLGAVFAIRQRDLKALLAYSTVSKLGALVALIGLPHSEGIKAAIVGILAHALYKGALFLVVGTIDHSTGTRVIDKLGGLWKYMPRMGIVTIISALSMAGVPIFFGFVAKEVLIDAFYEAHLHVITVVTVVVSSLLGGTAGYILIWDVFFRKPQEEIHYHAAPALIDLGPLVMAAGSALLGILVSSVIEPLIDPAVTKEFHLYLFPPEITPEFVTVFSMSLFAIGGGFVLFLLRNYWLPANWMNIIPGGTAAFRQFLKLTDDAGDFVLRSQGGQVRYYLVVILGIVAIIVIGSGLLLDLTRGQQLALEGIPITSTDIFNIMLIVLAIGGMFGSILFKRHLLAAISLGVGGYAIGGIFLLEPAPDVALVQFLVETLSTVLIIVMIGRISSVQRTAIMNRLWEGRSALGVWRDALIAFIAGFSVFIFALTAIMNRTERETIATWHIANAYKELGIPDIVGAIVTDFRGTDTMLEITVFSVAALGVLTLLSRGRERTMSIMPGQQIKQYGELESDSFEEIQDTTRLSTPFTRMVALFTLPFALIISSVHLLYGGEAPGDGFTAGVVSGLAIALWYIVFGYEEAKQRLGRFQPIRFVRGGILLSIINAVFPLFIGQPFLHHIPIDIYLPANLHLSSTLFFEIGIGLTVFGSVGLILEAIAHPKEVAASNE